MLALDEVVCKSGCIYGFSSKTQATLRSLLQTENLCVLKKYPEKNLLRENSWSIFGTVFRNCGIRLFECPYYPKYSDYFSIRRSQWPRGLRRWSAASRLLRSWVRIPPDAWMFVCCECCVLSGRGLYDELITRPEESYRM